MIGAERIRALLASDFVRHSATVFVASMLVNVLGYAFHFTISRKLGVVGYGEVSALNAAFMLSIVVPQIGSTIVVKYAAGYRAAHDVASLATLTRRCMVVSAALALVALVVLGALAGPIASFLRVGDPVAVLLAMAMFSFSMGAGVSRGLFLGTEDFGGYAISAVLESSLKFVLGAGLVYLGYGVAGAFGGWAVGSLIALVYNAIVLLRPVARTASIPLDIHVGSLVRTMAGVSAATLLVAIVTNADLLVVKHFSDATTAGLYGALSLSGKILLFLVAFVPLIVLPKATRTALSGKPAGGILLQALIVSVAMSVPGLVVYYLAPRFVLTLLAGKAFGGGAPYVFGYGVAMVELAIMSVIVNFKIGIHRFDFIVPLTLCAAAEVVGMAAYHATIANVIAVLVLGNLVAAVVVSWGVWARPAAVSAAHDWPTAAFLPKGDTIG